MQQNFFSHCSIQNGVKIIYSMRSHMRSLTHIIYVTYYVGIHPLIEVLQLFLNQIFNPKNFYLEVGK